jgi:hypothetical protein
MRSIFTRRNKMEKSESIVELTKALIKAQGELEVVTKDTKAYNYLYATLPAVFAEYKKHFLKHGLVVMQLIEGNGLRTTLSHESGEWVSSVAALMPIKNDPQAQGSAITYMRRYSLGAICGIMTEEDDDAQKAMPATKPTEAYKKPVESHSEAPKIIPGCITPAQAKRFYAIYKFAGKSDDEAKAYLKEHYGIDDSSKITKEDYESICEWAKGE